MSSERPKTAILRAAIQWWSDLAREEGHFAAARKLAGGMWAFVRDSAPERLRQRYGDADYDWDHRVNTTSGAVGWRDRLMGVFHSPYQPTEPALFHEMIEALRGSERLDLRGFTFIDLGSGKGRTLLMASDYGFRRILGVELLPSLHAIAEQNLGQYKSEIQQCFALQSICADATEFSFPDEALIVYLFNPFPIAGLRRVLANLDENVRRKPRPVYVLYHNPALEQVLLESSGWKRLGGTHQYSIFAFNS